MEQKDYIKREIEKIGLIMTSIRQKLLGGKESTAISVESSYENTKNILLNSVNFDLDKFLAEDKTTSNNYISTFQGFNVENLDFLASYLMQLGMNPETLNSRKYLEKSLQLLELCNKKDKTYSTERETSIEWIKNSIAD